MRGELKRSGVTAKSLLESGEIGQGESAPATTPSRGASLSHSTSIGKKHARPVLQVRDLPVSAFQQASTSAFAHAGAPSSIAIGGRPTSESTGGDSRPGLGKRRKSTNEGFGLSLDMQMQMAAQEEEPSTPGSESTGEKRMATNPFFDNIRQNSEASRLTWTTTSEQLLTSGLSAGSLARAIAGPSFSRRPRRNPSYFRQFSSILSLRAGAATTNEESRALGPTVLRVGSRRARATRGNSALARQRPRQRGRV